MKLSRYVHSNPVFAKAHDKKTGRERVQILRGYAQFVSDRSGVMSRYVFQAILAISILKCAAGQGLVLMEDITAPGDFIYDLSNGLADSPNGPTFAIDDDPNTQYITQLCSGFRVTPSERYTSVFGLGITTAKNDYRGDPIEFEISGYRESVRGPYTLIATGRIEGFAQEQPWPRMTQNKTSIRFPSPKKQFHQY